MSELQKTANGDAMFGTSCPPSARDGKPALGVHFGLTTRFLSAPKTALLACGTHAVGLYERAGIAISARRYAFSAEIVVFFMGGPVRKYMLETYFLIRVHGPGNHFYSNHCVSCTALFAGHVFRAGTTRIFWLTPTDVVPFSIEKPMAPAHGLPR